MEHISGRGRRPSVGDFDGQPEVTDRAIKPFAATAPGGVPGKHEEVAAGTRIGEYEVEAKIGEGAMGTVYRAVHPAIGKHVAIKVMTPKLFDEPESVKRFVAEARAIAAIRHPGIVDIFGFGRVADGRTYLVMEWLDGSSLAARMQQGPLPLEEAIDMLRQIARALEAAHGKGIIHRDLKPENVFIQHIDGEKPQCKLLDFGLAKVTTKEDRLVAKTRTGQMLGTPLYMSPEQCKSKGVDHRTDIYALGCMAYEMLAGRVPFDADNIAELISAHLVAEPPRPSKLAPDISPILDELLFKMIAKNADERPTLADVRRQLSSVLTRPSAPIGAVSAEDLTPPPPTGPVSKFDTGQIRKFDTGQLLLQPPAEEPREAVVPEVTRPFPWLGVGVSCVIVAVAVALLVLLR